jgi:predicted TIM-barrel fold metal-dependent hydrolase
LCDQPANEATYTKMEELDFLGASIHVSQPYPTKWCNDVVKFWEAQNAWERVLDRHPKMTVVMAHMFNYNTSDEQLDYLSYVMETYPNVHLDLAARIGWFGFLDREKIRAFIIKYSDRILFGTDLSEQIVKEQPTLTARRYHRCFQILETEEIIPAGFYGAPGEGRKAVKGLALPMDVLEAIYFKNAVRLYPGVGDTLNDMGYDF